MDLICKCHITLLQLQQLIVRAMNQDSNSNNNDAEKMDDKPFQQNLTQYFSPQIEIRQSNAEVSIQSDEEFKQPPRDSKMAFFKKSPRVFKHQTPTELRRPFDIQKMDGRFQFAVSLEDKSDKQPEQIIENEIQVQLNQSFSESIEDHSLFSSKGIIIEKEFNDIKRRKSVFQKEQVMQMQQIQRQSTHKKVQITKSEKFNGYVKFASLGINQMLSYDQEQLEYDEPESSKTNYFKYLKKLVMFIIALYLILTIVVKSFEKHGQEKIQSISSNMTTSLEFDLEGSQPDQLLPFHWFFEVNRQSVVDRMECLINKDSERCFEMKEQACRAQFDVKGRNYENCMMRSYKLYAKDQQNFCQDLYYESDTYYPSERSSQTFLNKYHECMLAAGVPMGKQYCDDIYGPNAEASDSEELYKCYKKFGVNQLLYAEDQCLTEYPPIIAEQSCIDTDEGSNGD